MVSSARPSFAIVPKMNRWASEVASSLWRMLHSNQESGPGTRCRHAPLTYLNNPLILGGALASSFLPWWRQDRPVALLTLVC